MIRTFTQRKMMFKIEHSQLLRRYVIPTDFVTCACTVSQQIRKAREMINRKLKTRNTV